jgi:2-polyprenyl-6-methoxyphenol hydroxylase-like FAD-dependent oxidoreductase
MNLVETNLPGQSSNNNEALMLSKVMIVGAGTGGLCLAQGLRKSGIDVAIFERDRTPTDRLQGYRLHISSNGAQALEHCLPATLFKEFLGSAAKSNQAVNFLDFNLKRLLTFAIVDHPHAESREIPIGRITLRKVLLRDLETVVNFEKKFQRYEQRPDGSVVVHFEDGSTAQGGLLIGADGASSTVRGQLLPEAKRIETGIVAISGKAPLNDYVRRITPTEFFAGPTLVLGPDGRFLFGSAVEFPSNDCNTAVAGQLDSPSSDDLLFGERVEYVMWGFSCRRQLFRDFARASGDELLETVLRLTTGWHATLRALIEATAPETTTAFEVKSAERIAPWNTGRVTLLGDALHNMTPYRGMGANMALLDADSLRRALLRAHRGESELIPALHDYEAEMIDRGFRAVDASLRQMKQVHSQGRFANAMRGFSLRTIDRFPVRLKKAIMQRQ